MTRNFIVSGFRLPTALVYSASAGAAAQLLGGVATISDGAKSFVSRLVMQTITDVLEQQGRSAGLPDAIILMIMNQPMVQISYDPLECKTVTVGIPVDGKIDSAMMLEPKSKIKRRNEKVRLLNDDVYATSQRAHENGQAKILVDRSDCCCSSSITGVTIDMQPQCIIVGGTVTVLCTNVGPDMCDVNMNMGIGAIDSKHLSISENLTV
ncbi:hypothetical protein KIN20_023558 [Parelaphostrongylus tenuis]|uniref:Uncharacterized protein n=1 Tax=Parelaphostrongylus tenuis TaxID=148309 RepID=A0AAD5QT09_PARTN|nr:hypothetical protein KIN20_023558 [Parelaphostrongylus tenuis]